MLDGLQAEVRFHVHHAGVLENLLHYQFRKVIYAVSHHLHEVVLRAAHGVTFNDMRLLGYPLVERFSAFIRLFFHRHLYECGDGKPQFALIYLGEVTAYEAGSLQRLDAAKSR